MSYIKIINLNTACGLQPQVSAVVLNEKLLLWADISMEKNPVKSKSYSFIRQIDLSSPQPRFIGGLSMRTKARLGRIMGRIIMEKAYSLTKVSHLTPINYRATDATFQRNTEVILHGTGNPKILPRKQGTGLLGSAYIPNLYITTFIDVSSRQIQCFVNDPLQEDSLTEEQLQRLETQYYTNLCNQLKLNKYCIVDLFDENINKKRQFVITNCGDYSWGIALDIVKDYAIFDISNGNDEDYKDYKDYYVGGNGIIVSINNVK